jgi:hypothetical protein
VKRILLLLIVSLTFADTNAQTDIDINVFIDKCMEKVNKIDNKAMYTVPVSYGKYNGYNRELSAIMYFDENGILQKAELIYNAEISGIGYYIRYFDKDGNLIHSILNASFGPSGACFAARYISREDELMHVDFVSKHKEDEGLMLERIIRTGRPFLPMPLLDGKVYDSVFNIEDLLEENRRLFEIDSLHLPNKIVPVTFIMPQVGDTTYVRQNHVPTYKKPENEIMGYIDICDVAILEVKNGWYKIRELECGMEGYINSKYLAPVKRLVK